MKSVKLLTILCILLSILLFTNNGIASELDLKTSWGQRGPYLYEFDGNVYRVGCSAVAIGQLINYYFQKGYRVGWLERMLQGIEVYPRFCQTGEKKCKKKTINSPNYETKSTYPFYESSIEHEKNSPGAADLRNFLWNVAIGLDSTFSKDGSTGASSGNKLVKLLKERFRFKNTLYASKSFKRLNDKQTKDYIINSIDSGQPVLMSMNLKSKEKGITEGHLALIYGYQEQGDVFKTKINWGWGNRGGENNEYYNTSDKYIDVIFTDTNGETINFGASNFVLYVDALPINAELRREYIIDRDQATDIIEEYNWYGYQNTGVQFTVHDIGSNTVAELYTKKKKGYLSSFDCARTKFISPLYSDDWWDDQVIYSWELNLWLMKGMVANIYAYIPDAFRSKKTKNAYYKLAICYEYSCWWSPDGPFIDQVSIDQSSINGDWILLFKNIYIPDDAYVIISLDNETDEDNKYVIFDAVKIVAQ